MDDAVRAAIERLLDFRISHVSNATLVHLGGKIHAEGEMPVETCRSVYCRSVDCRQSPCGACVERRAEYVIPSIFGSVVSLTRWRSRAQHRHRGGLAPRLPLLEDEDLMLAGVKK
jgi:hypothetical protein